MILPDTTVPPVECVLPAAGLSRRMGAFKPLVSYDGRPLVDHALDTALAVCERVILVTGYRSDELVRAVQDYDRVDIVHNVSYRDGMVSSIAEGARHVTTDWFFVSPVDMPHLTQAIYRALLNVLRDSDDILSRNVAAIFPTIAGRRGHPVLISSRVIPDLEERYPSVDSMRAFLASYPVEEHELSDLPEHRGIFFDIDTPLV